METAEKTAEKGNTSYPIHAIHYNGIPAFNQVKQLPKITPSKSLLPDIRVGTFSHHFGESPKYAVKDGRVYLRTANALHSVSIDDFLKYGTFFGEDDFGMKEWLAVGEDVKPADFDIVPVDRYYKSVSYNKNEGAVEGVPLRMYLPNKRDSPVNLYVRNTDVNAPINRAGYWASQIENFEQDLRDFLFDYREMKRGDHNPEAAAWFDFISRKGYKNFDQLISIGKGLLDDKVVAATLHGNPEGYVSLLANKNFKEYIREMMGKYSLYDENSLRLGKDAVIMHETLHFSPKGQQRRGLGFFKSGRRIEHNAGRIQAKFYHKRKGEVDSEDVKAYTALEKDHADYARHWSLKSRLSKYFKIANIIKSFGTLNRDLNLGYEGRSIDSVIEQFRNEARLLGFTESEEDSYVESRLNEYESRKQAENFEKETTSKSENNSGLEALVKAGSKSGKGDSKKRNREAGSRRHERDGRESSLRMTVEKHGNSAEYESEECSRDYYSSEKEYYAEDGDYDDSRNSDSEGEENESRGTDKKGESDSKDSGRESSNSRD